MAYFCYIHRKTGGVPHFEVLPESSESGAIGLAAHLLADRADGLRAEVWDGERLVFTLPRTAAPPQPGPTTPGARPTAT
jgi:hypothetical protein